MTTTTPELDRKLNGAENANKSSTSGEEDPCIEESKVLKMSFKDRTENKLREKSGLSRKGLLIAGAVLLVLLLLLIVVIALGAAWPRTPHHAKFPVCGNAACLRAAAQIQEALNTSVSPCTDIWTWSCGRWLKNNPLPSERSIWNRRQLLKVQEASRIRELISTLPLPVFTGTLEWKLKHLYESCMEIDNVDADGVQPLVRIIRELGGWKILRDWNVHSWDYRRVLERLHSEYGATPFFKITVVPNPQFPRKNIIRISPAGLGLPGRSFYYADPDNKVINAYKRLMQDIVSKLQATSTEASKFSTDTFHYEKRIAEITPESIYLQDPINTYNPISVSELKITAFSLPLREILVSMFPKAGITDDTEVLVSSPDYLSAISSIVSSTDRNALNNYLIWCLVREYLPYLTSEYTAELQQYISELKGIQKPVERWEQCINMVQKFMGLSVQSKLENYDPISEKSKTLINNMFKKIRTATLNHISKNEIPSEFRKHITQKTAGLNVQIGFKPNVTTELFLSSYYVKLYVQKSNLFQNILNGYLFLLREQEQRYLEPNYDYSLIPFGLAKSFKIGYSGPTNTIVIPRELLTSPYFEPEYPKSIIYGRLGVDITLAVASSILPYDSSWTNKKGLLSQYHLTVNESIKATATSRNCLAKYIVKNNYAMEEIADMTSLSTLKHLTALRIADTALSLELENSEHIHQPTLEIYEDSALFYMSYAQNQCSQSSEQQELLDNFVEFTLPDRILLKTSWAHVLKFSETLQCTNANARCSDIL